MKAHSIRKLNKIHVQQQDQTACGVACLQAVFRYFGNDQVSLERLRELSGTSLQGTSLLGLYQAANTLGLQAQGYECDLPHLRQCRDVCIVHIVKENTLQHYIVNYGYDDRRKAFLIGDPAQDRVGYMPEQTLERLWQSKCLLLLQPTEQFEKTSLQNNRKWSWLKTLIREDWNILGMALALGIAMAVLGLATAIFSQRLLDHLLPAKDLTGLYTGLVMLLLLLLARNLLGYMRQLFLLQQSRNFNIRVIDYFFSRLLQLPKPFFDNRKTGDLIARLNDTRRIQATLTRLSASLTIDLLMALLSLIAIYVYHWQSGILVSLWIPLFAWIAWRFHRPILLGQQKVLAGYALSESNYVDTIQGIGAVKMANKQSFFGQTASHLYGLFQSATFRLGRTGLMYGTAMESLGALGLVGILSFASIGVMQGDLTAGGLMAILQMTGVLMASTAQIAGANMQLQEAKVAFDRMYEFASIQSEQEEEMELPQAKIFEWQALHVEHLSFRFPGRKRLLENLDFHLYKGEWIALLGESGCGKSTLLQILQKFYRPESGKIKVNGNDLELIGYESWRTKLGVVPQQIKVFNGTVLDNILLGDEPLEWQGLQAFFEYYGFDAYFNKLPNGYATLVGEEGVNLSGGQQQLLALARALYRRPELLLLDEPTAALDRDTEQFVLRLLHKLKHEMGILMFTHRLHTTRQADRIYLIENGRIANQGNHADLLLSDNLYSRAWYDVVGGEGDAKSMLRC